MKDRKQFLNCHVKNLVSFIFDFSFCSRAHFLVVHELLKSKINARLKKSLISQISLEKDLIWKFFFRA